MSELILKELDCRVTEDYFLIGDESMKFRKGFVSNSSSSSFIMIAREIEVKDLDISGYELAYQKKLHAACYEDALNNGVDLFIMDPIMLANYLKWHILEGIGNKLYFYDVYKFLDINGSQGIEIYRENIPYNGAKLYPLSISYHSTENFNDFMNKYFSEVDLSDIIKEYPSYEVIRSKINEKGTVSRAELMDFD